MNYRLCYIIIIVLTLSATSARAQSIALGFADSIRIALENTRNLDAQVVGGGLTIAWNNVLLDQQTEIQKQFRTMKRRGFKLRPHIVEYFGAIVNAVNVEGIDPTRFANFLKVANKVIEN